MQNTDNKYAWIGYPVEDDVALMLEAEISGAQVSCIAAETRELPQGLEDPVQAVNILGRPIEPP